MKDFDVPELKFDYAIFQCAKGVVDQGRIRYDWAENSSIGSLISSRNQHCDCHL